MAKAKRREITQEALEMVAVRFKVLSDPLRLKILQTLEAGPRSVNELAETVAASQPSVSKHLKMLQEAGFVGRRQEGNSVFYSIADPMVFDLCTLMCDSLEQRLAAQASVFGKRA
jgi:ArsR family transcriptional regulator